MKLDFNPEKRVITEKSPPVFACESLIFFTASGSGILHVNGVKLKLKKRELWLASHVPYLSVRTGLGGGSGAVLLSI